jgi:nucleoside-diphosphate-sugar epimerase
MALRILLVGANGFIGASINKFLLESKLNVFPTSRKTSNNTKILDIFKQSTWDVLKEEIKPDVVICTAWETEHNFYWEKQTNYDFMEATIKFAIYCFRNGVKKFICIGSMSEYGFSPGKCNALTTQVNPQDHYSEAKVLASIALGDAAHKFGKKANWVRLFQPYGPNEKVERLIPLLINNMTRNIPIEIKFPDHKLDFTHTEDIAKSLTKIAEFDYDYSINLGTGTATSVKAIALMLSEKFRYSATKIRFCTPDYKSERLIFVDPESEIFYNNLKPTIDIYSGLNKIST